MSFHFIKKTLKFFFYYSFAIYDITKIILKIKSIDKKKIFLQVEGGFGFTISSPHFLNIKLGDSWLLLFGFKKERHNIEVERIHNGKLKFFNVGNLNHPEFRSKFEKFIKSYLKFIFNIDIIIWRDYLFSIENPNKKNNKEYLSLPDSRQFFVFKDNKKDFYLNNYFKTQYNFHFKIFNGNFKGKINFFLRGKGKKFKSSKFIENIKDSRHIDDYKLTLEFLVDNGWQVFLTGEEFEIPNWIKQKKNSIIFREKTNLSINNYNMFVANNQDIFIGRSSGAGVLNLLNHSCKSLLLEDGHIGCGYINTVASYPKIAFKDLDDFYEVLYKGFANLSYINLLYEKNLVLPLSPQELKHITEEFINNLESNNFFKKADEIGIDKGILYDCDTKLSNYWLELVNFKYLK